MKNILTYFFKIILIFTLLNINLQLHSIYLVLNGQPKMDGFDRVWYSIFDSGIAQIVLSCLLISIYSKIKELWLKYLI